MDRRLILKQILMATAAAALIPSCTFQKKAGTVPLTHLKIDDEQEELLAQILDTLLPSGAVPGAKTLDLRTFVLRMIDDCYEPEVQQDFVTGLGQFEVACKEQKGKLFGACTSEERIAFLASCGNDNSKNPKELTATYKLIRQLSIQGFLTSQYVMESEGYEFVPARFHGCVDLSKSHV